MIRLGREKRVHYKVSVSFLEVYNENIRDLLNDSEEFLDLREDPIKGIELIDYHVLYIKCNCYGCCVNNVITVL